MKRPFYMSDEQWEEYQKNGCTDNIVPLVLDAREHGDGASGAGIVGLSTIDPTRWEGAPIPPREWIVPDCVPHRTVTLLSGDGGQGKSLLAQQLAVGRALAREWIGLLPEPGRTLILSAEDDADEIQRRLAEVLKFYSARFADLSDMRIVDLVGEDPVLGQLMKGRIEPAPMYRALDATMSAWPPTLVILDVLAEMFAGNECDRAQVRQFIGLLKRLARKHGSAILLLAHPSLAGMNTGSGLSGSTDWNNGVRSRLYMQTPKLDDGSEPNKNLRTLEGMKSNYGERGAKIDLEWKNGVFVRLAGPIGFDKLAAEANANDTFLLLVAKFRREGRDVSPNPGPTFAPAIFGTHPDAAGLSKEKLCGAMNRLLDSGKVKVETFGRAGKQRSRLVMGEECGNV